MMPKDPIRLSIVLAKRETLLRAARVNPEMSSLELADRVGCHKTTAHVWLKEAGLSRPPRREARGGE